MTVGIVIEAMMRINKFPYMVIAQAMFDVDQIYASIDSALYMVQSTLAAFFCVLLLS